MHARPAALGDRLRAVASLLVDPDDLPGRDVPHRLRADEVEGARLRGDDPVVADPAEGERPDPERVAEGDERAVGDGDDRVGALEAAHGRRDGLRERRRIASEKRSDDLGIGARGEPDAGREELLPQRLRIDEVPVVPERDRPRRPVEDERLRVAHRAPPVVE